MKRINWRHGAQAFLFTLGLTLGPLLIALAAWIAELLKKV